MKYIATTDCTLIEALEKLSPESSKTTLRSWLKEDRITLNGKVVKLSHHPVNKGEEIALSARPKLIKGGIRIYYEDKHLVVIEKPVGLLSVATAFEKGDTLFSHLKEHYKPRKVFVVHRLDQETSGVMVFALSQPAFEKLKSLFEVHDIKRSYAAIVEGKMTQRSGTWQSFLYEDEQYVVHTTEDETKGRIATTHYKVDATNKRFSALTLNLETGRKNQIRVHCQEAGHSVVGDKKYGAESNPIKRLCLHAKLLEFKHPITNEPMKFESPVPEIFSQLIRP